MTTKDTEHATDWDAAADTADLPDVPALEVEAAADQIGETAAHLNEVLGGEPAPVREPDESAPIQTVEELPADPSLPRFTAADAPVSEKNDPIKLVEPPEPALSIVTAGNVDIISTRDRIQVVERGLAAEVAPPVREQAVMASKVVDKITAEQEAGRKALARHAERAALYPRPAPEPTGNVEVFRPGDIAALQRHMLNTPAPGKGPGY